MSRLGLLVVQGKDPGSVSRLGLVVRGSAGKQKDPGSVSRLGLVVKRSAGKRKDPGSVSRLGLVARCSAGKRKDPGSSLHFGAPFSSNIVVYGHFLVTLPSTIINKTLKWLTSLPILMRKSFWW